MNKTHGYILSDVIQKALTVTSELFSSNGNVVFINIGEQWERNTDVVNYCLYLKQGNSKIKLDTIFIQMTQSKSIEFALWCRLKGALNIIVDIDGQHEVNNLLRTQYAQLLINPWDGFVGSLLSYLFSVNMIDKNIFLTSCYPYIENKLFHDLPKIWTVCDDTTPNGIYKSLTEMLIKSQRELHLTMVEKYINQPDKNKNDQLLKLFIRVFRR